MESFAQGMQRLAVQFPPFVIAVVFHEYAHGFVASRFGDLTAKERGRLTLNPVPHMDVIGTLVFPILNMLMGLNFLFGWARPVPIDPRRFKKFRPGLFWVSFAGPLMNFFLAALSALLFCALLRFMPRDFYLFEPLASMAEVSVMLNFALGIFNLIPLPPLDGSKMIESVLPVEWTLQYEKITRYSFFILIALLLSGAFSVLETPIRVATGFTLALASIVMGIPGVFS